MQDPRVLAEDFTTQLRRQLGDRVQAAALFGSAARAEWIEGVSDVNVLILVDDIDAALLGRAVGAARAAAVKGVRPLLMEHDEWRSGADVFAIELADMRDAHIPLYGADPVSAATASTADLRLQAERELRAKLLHLHGGMLLNGGDRKRLGQLFVHALPSFITYLRTALRLAGDTVPGTSQPVIEAGCRLIGADAAAFLRVLHARTGRQDLAIDLSDPTAEAYNTTAERLTTFVDTFGGGTT